MNEVEMGVLGDQPALLMRRDVAASLDQVWQAVSDAARLQKWFLPGGSWPWLHLRHGVGDGRVGLELPRVAVAVRLGLRHPILHQVGLRGRRVEPELRRPVVADRPNAARSGKASRVRASPSR